MAVLSDAGIRTAIAKGDINIEPIIDGSIQPASIDVHLGNSLLYPPNDMIVYDPADPPAKKDYEVINFGVGDGHYTSYRLSFGSFVLGSTFEHITLGPNYTAHIDGISSLGRLGLVIHSGSCWIDPGFYGNVTLEMSVGSRVPVVLREGMRIGQLVIEEVEPPAEMLYGDPFLSSKYQGQTGPGAARA